LNWYLLGGVIATILPEAEYNRLFHPATQAAIISTSPGDRLPRDDSDVWRAKRVDFTLYAAAMEDDVVVKNS
jgi:hypothetical protein